LVGNRVDLEDKRDIYKE